MKGTILSVIRNPKGIFGNIRSGGIKYYYNIDDLQDKTIMITNGDLVEFDVIKQKRDIDRATNIKLIRKKEEKPFPEAGRALVLPVLLEKTENDQFIDASTFPKITLDAGLGNFRQYSDGVDDFINTYFSNDFDVLKNVCIGDRRYSAIIVRKDKIVGIMAKVKPAIDEKLHEAGYLLLSEVPFILQACEVNYKEYAENLSEFFNKYFPGEYLLRQKYVQNGIVIQDVLLKNDSEHAEAADEQLEETETEQSTTEQILSYLDELYAEQKYLEYLSSEKLQMIPLSALPEQYIEQTFSCAAHLLYEDQKEFTLTLFQKELIKSETGKTFLRKWKKGSVYSETILSSYVQSAIYECDLSYDIGIIVKTLNNLFGDTKINNNFNALISRFEACRDSLTYLLYVIKACSVSSQVNINKTIWNYCQFLKSLKGSTLNSKINYDHEMTLFKSFLRIVTGKLSVPLNRMSMHNALSVCLDLNKQEQFAEFLPIICPDQSDVTFLYEGLFQNYKTWTEKQYELLFSSGLSLQIIEKISAYLWDRDNKQDHLNKDIINMLVQMLYYGNSSVIEEVLKIHISGNFTKKQKTEALLNSFPEIVQGIQQCEKWILLASYVIHAIYKQTNKTDLANIDTQALDYLEEWNAVVDQWYWIIIERLGNLCEENESEYLSLLHLFQFEHRKTQQVQERYDEWYRKKNNQYDDLSQEQMISCLDHVREKKADFTYAAIYELGLDKNYIFPEEYDATYISSLLNLHRYNQILSYIKNTDRYTQDQKERFMVQTICANFVYYGFSDEAFVLFTDALSIQEAIALLEPEISAFNHQKVISLILLYIRHNELLKSIYIFLIYKSKIETGYARIFSEYYKKYGKYFNKLHNRYDVILKAFETLPYDQLYTFIQWVSTINIPELSGVYPDGNPLAKPIDKLVKTPNNISSWKDLILYLYEHKDIEKNQWPLCAGSIMARHIFNAPDFPELHDLFVSFLDTVNMNSWPDSMVFYIAQYIVDNNDDQLCEKLYQTLSIPMAAERLLADNPWMDNKKRLNFFVEYCVKKLSQTNNILYFNMQTVMKNDLTGEELVDMSSFSANKIFLLKKICEYFLEGKNLQAAVELLSNENIWQNMTFQESEFYHAESMLFISVEEILDQQPTLFHNEEEVMRFKRDIALILKEYPSQMALEEFDKNCQDLAHKLRIYSYIYGVFGRESLYKNNKYSYDELLNKNIEYEFLAFLRTCYISQLFYNSTYEYFYKLWRYYRLQIIKSWDGEDPYHDEELIDLMTKFQNYDMAINMGYEGFRDTLSVFVKDGSLTSTDKKYIMYGLLQEDFTDIYHNHPEIMTHMDENIRNIVQKLVLNLDYRDINNRLFEYYCADIENHILDKAYETASCFSSSFRYLLDVFAENDNYTESLQIVTDFMHRTHMGITKEILDMSDEQYGENKKLHDAVLITKQLPFKIYNRIRTVLVNQKRQFCVTRYNDMTQMLSNIGYTSANAQYHYLLALGYALVSDVDNLRGILSINNVFMNLPVELASEVERLKQFAETDGESPFKPERNIEYSGEGQTRRKHLNYIKEVCAQYQVDVNEKLDTNTFQGISKKYYDEDSDIVDRISSGFRMILFLTKNNIDKPDPHQLSFEVGLLAASKYSNLSADNKLFILLDLFQNWGINNKTQEQQIYQCFTDCYNHISIYKWVQNYNTISQIVLSSGDTNGAAEINLLCENILSKAPGLSTKDPIPSEDLYQQLSEISYIGRSIYSLSIMRSVEKEKTEIEHSVRMLVTIENVVRDVYGTISDGYVYLCVKNIGNISVDLYHDCSITLFIEPEDGVPYAPIQAEISGIKELRPGWITGIRVDVSAICKERAEGDILNGKVIISVNDIPICSTDKKLIVSPPAILDSIPEPDNNGYYVDYAVGTDELEQRLYGRADEKDDIKKKLERGNIVIYGPSRIGKTSLLNWLVYSYADERKNVISVLVGNEKTGGKENDYTKSVLENHKEFLNYGDVDEITEHLLANTIVTGLTLRERETKLPDGIYLHESDFLKQICDVLINRERSIISRYYDVDMILQKQGYEIWIIFDEFQQLIDNWKFKPGQLPDDFINICARINTNIFKKIKFVFCGSDELMRQMMMTGDSIWRTKIFNQYAKPVPVGPIKKAKPGQTDEFEEMIRSDKAVRLPGLHYSKMALDTLSNFSNRVPLYAKEICNTVLGTIRAIGIKQNFGRNYIYSYDISLATQALMEQQNNKANEALSESLKPRIAQIFDAITKGMESDRNTDKQYLWLMATEFMKHPDKESFNFNEYEQVHGYAFLESNSLNERLEVLQMRGIIHGNKDIGYTFSTPFFYSAFCGTADQFIFESILMKQLPNEDQEDTLDGHKQYAFELPEQLDIIPNWQRYEMVKTIFESISPASNQGDLALALLKRLDQDEEKRVLSLIGDQYGGDNVHGSKKVENVEGNKIDTVNVQFIQINQVAESVAGLSALIGNWNGDPGEITDSQLSKFNPQIVTEQLGKFPALHLLESGTKLDPDDDLDLYDTDEYENTIKEGVVKSLADGKISNEESLIEWAGHEDTRIQLHEINIADDDIDYVLSLPERDRESILVSLYLRLLFDKIKTLSEHTNSSVELDYSPVTIMLGKTLERILIEKHMPVYLNRNVWKNQVHAFFGNGQDNPLISFKGIITMGTFTTALQALFKVAYKDPEKLEKYENRDRFLEATHVVQPIWSQYTANLTKAKTIRNKTGHTEIVLQEDCDLFLELFFELKLLQNTMELVDNVSY